MSTPGGVGRTPFGIAVGIGAAAMTAAVMAAALLFAPTQIFGRLVVVSIAAGGYAAIVADTRASLVTAGLGYLLFDGFLVNGYGDLSWNGTTTIWHLTVFVLAVGLGLGQRWIRAVQADPAFADELDSVVEHTMTNTKE